MNNKVLKLVKIMNTDLHIIHPKFLYLYGDALLNGDEQQATTTPEFLM